MRLLELIRDIYRTEKKKKDELRGVFIQEQRPKTLGNKIRGD